ncbi:MAG: hypothetical protein WAM66_07590 [Acidobacteriaceae bacterium]
MSKAIEGAAMIGAVAGVFAADFLSGGLLTPFVVAAMPELLSMLAGGVAMEAGAIADALTQNRGMGITTRQPAAFRQIIRGTQRVGGVIVYESTTGGHHDQYNFIIVLATHEVDAIENLYLDGRRVHWTGSGSGNVTRNGVNFGGQAGGGDFIGPGGQHYNFDTLVYCEARFGDQADGDVISGMTANDPTWAASSGGSPYLGGCCYVYLKVEYDAAMFPGLPEIKFTVRGKNNIYDPRTGTSGFSNNWALNVADVLEDEEWGLGDAGSVNQDQLIAAANVCDEQVDLLIGGTESRYCMDWHCDTGTAPGDQIQTMMPAAAGRLSRIGGEWFIWPAYWTGPSFTFDENALTGKVQWTPYRKFRDLVNRVNGTYIAPNSPWNVAGNLYDANGWYDGSIANQFPFAFQPTSYPQYAADALHGYGSDQFLAEDGNIQLPKEIVQSCVLSVAQAQRCAKIILFRNRQQGTGMLPMSLAAWAMQPIDVMQMTFAAMGWATKQLEIVSTRFIVGSGSGEDAPSVRLEVGVQETDASTYEWSTAEELSVYDVPGNPPQAPYEVAAPTGLTLASSATTALTGADGTVTPRILASWTAPEDSRAVQIQIQYQKSGDTGWTDAGAADAATTSVYIAGVISGQTYNVQIRSLSYNGASSAWVEATGCVVSAPNSAQSGYSNNPAIALSQPTATTVAVAAVAVTFGSATVNYAARTLTIAAPSAPTWYYVTIADAAQQGEAGSPTLTATCQTSNALAGVQGNTYMGAILALPAGAATQILAGGWPAPQTFQVGS